MPSHDIFHLNYGDISYMYILNKDFQYKCPARLLVNVKEQILLANLSIPIHNDDIVAFSLDRKNVQIVQIISFMSSHFKALYFKKIENSNKFIIWKLMKTWKLNHIDHKNILR